MVRTQIQLTEEQHQGLRRLAARLGISMSEAIRRCVAERLARADAEPTRQERIREALAVCGKYEDPAGASTVAEDHDRRLAEAIEG
jgi:hypothetical protein